jgi:hypothetical protein
MAAFRACCATDVALGWAVTHARWTRRGSAWMKDSTVCVLAVLSDERLVARADLKADREGRRPLVLSARREDHAPAEPVAGALAKELRTMATWLGLGSVSVVRQATSCGCLRRRLAEWFASRAPVYAFPELSHPEWRPVSRNAIE